MVDNAASMASHWPILEFVVYTLSKKVAGLDKSGIDLRFTVHYPKNHDLKRLKGEEGRRKIKEALDAARPSSDRTTDMDKVLRVLFEEWRRSHGPPTTLIIFTDGIWGDTDVHAFEKKLIEGLKLVQGRHSGHENHYFTIQFVRFGDDPNAIERLQKWDDDLCNSHRLE